MSADMCPRRSVAHPGQPRLWGVSWPVREKLLLGAMPWGRSFPPQIEFSLTICWFLVSTVTALGSQTQTLAHFSSVFVRPGLYSEDIEHLFILNCVDFILFTSSTNYLLAFLVGFFIFETK